MIRHVIFRALSKLLIPLIMLFALYVRRRLSSGGDL